VTIRSAVESSANLYYRAPFILAGNWKASAIRHGRSISAEVFKMRFDEGTCVGSRNQVELGLGSGKTNVKQLTIDRRIHLSLYLGTRPEFDRSTERPPAIPTRTPATLSAARCGRLFVA
jgi:hypothetical protein